jgi:Competence protein CoiA-like family
VLESALFEIILINEIIYAHASVGYTTPRPCHSPMKNIKLPFGLKDEMLVHISEAQQGLGCGCVCPSCKEPLVARKGGITVHHFAHRKGSECAKAVETALHLAAKEILANRREITLPAVEIKLDCYRDPIPVSAERTFPLDEVRVEHRTEDIVPDILAYSGGHPLMIEIRVTHEVDEIKLAKIRGLDISVIEIDLSSMYHTFSRDELLDAVVHRTANKKWFFNARAERYKQMLLSTGEKKMRVRRGLATHVDHCPINIRKWKGKSYANVIDDCINCPYILDERSNDNVIVCGGRHKITTLDELLAFDTTLQAWPRDAANRLGGG